MNLTQIIFSKTTFFNAFFEQNAEELNIELSTEIFKDLISPDFDLSDLIDLEHKQFRAQGRSRFIDKYVLLMNKEIGDVFYSQINPSQYTPGSFQYVSSFVGFTQEAILDTLQDGTLSLILEKVSKSILMFMGMASGLSVPAAFLSSFLGFLLDKFKDWVGSQIEQHAEQIAAVKAWTTQVYSSFVFPEEFTVDYKMELKMMEIQNTALKIEMNEENLVQNSQERLKYYYRQFESLGFSDNNN